MPNKTYSGKFVLRLDPDLHAHLARLASKKGVSLNSLIATLLAGASSFRPPKN